MSPVIITSRLLPGVRVGDAEVSVEPIRRTRDGKPMWRWYIDAPEFSEEGDDLCGWGDAGEMLETLLAFLEACAESRAYARSTGRDGENAHLFSERVGAWAEASDSELSLLRCDVASEVSP